MCDVVFSYRQIYKVVCVVSSTQTPWNFVVRLVVFSLFEGMLGLNQTVVYALVVHTF